MLSRIFKPLGGSEATTTYILMKLGVNHPSIINSKTIEAIFDIPPPSSVMGPPSRVPQGGQKSQKFFLDFWIFFVWKFHIWIFFTWQNSFYHEK